MSQSSGFLDELDAELAGVPSNGRRSPSQSSSGEVAVTSTPRKAQPDSNGFGDAAPACDGIPHAADAQDARSRSNHEERSAAAVEASTSRATNGTDACAHPVIYRGLCGMCVPARSHALCSHLRISVLILCTESLSR